MATSSFSKTFVFGAEAVKAIKKQTAIKAPVSADSNRLKEGKEALIRFSPRSKK